MTGSILSPTLPDHHYDPRQKKLTIRGASVIPPEVFAWSDAIEILDMSHGRLTSLPAELSRLQNLRIAFFSYNPLAEVPKVLAQCPNLVMVGLQACNITTFAEDSVHPNLQGIILTGNQLQALPASIGNLGRLKKLMLSGNRLRSLPAQLAHCHDLELLRLAANDLSVMPSVLYELPGLAWYSDANNPYSPPPAIPRGKLLAWDQFTLDSKLGENNKNKIYLATQKATNRALAIKLYGTSLTSDGNSADEIAISLAVGDHPRIVPAKGFLPATSTSQQALVMGRIPSTYQGLGQPPSLSTLTRDIYPPHTPWSVLFILQVASDISDALEHLHGRGIMHGDVYAHNILTDPSGRSILGDFGAASYYKTAGKRPALQQHIDCKGFGHLLRELCGQVGAGVLPAELIELQQQCLATTPDDRPDFKEISRQLRRLLASKQ